MKHLSAMTMTIAATMLCSLYSCSIRVPTQGQAIISNKTAKEVFPIVIRAFSESGFTVQAADMDAGIISAVETASDTATNLSCSITEADGKVTVNMSGTKEAYHVRIAETRGTLKAAFKKLVQYLPEAQITINGKPFN